MAKHAEPPALTLAELIPAMKAFAKLGLSECDPKIDLVDNIGRRQQLRNEIDPSIQKIEAALAEENFDKGKNEYFLPLPAPPKHKVGQGFFLAFFRPKLRPKSGNNRICYFDLYFLVDKEGRSFGLRFERHPGSKNTHSYSHVQFTRKFTGIGLATDLPSFIPASYPALPSRCTIDSDAWLAAMVSIYGLSQVNDNGFGAIVRRVENGGELTVGAKVLERSRYLFLS